MHQRQQALESWLQKSVGFSEYQMTRLAGDASLRVYYRIQSDGRTYIAMDAPPKSENTIPFIAVANALRSQGIMTPEIFFSDIEHGFLLLTDFGDQLYLNQLNQDNARKLYSIALDSLSILQGCKKVTGWNVPVFTAQFMRQEMEWFREWFLDGYLKLSDRDEQKLNHFFDWVTTTTSKQPYVFMHRDFHSANLMVLPYDRVGVLDFQDAFIGPVTYDLVSLLRDCYIAWPEKLVNEWATSYLERLQSQKLFLNVNSDEFLCWFDCAGMQRHLKALMTFSRKYVRDQNAHYLKFIPRTLEYLVKVASRYSESKWLHHFLKETIVPTSEGIVCVP